MRRTEVKEEQRFEEIYLQGAYLPREIKGKINIRSCLSWHEEQQVYLVQAENGELAVLKAAQKQQAVFLKREMQFLESSRFPFVPHLFSWTEDGDGAWLLRQYIPGDTLWEKVERDGALDEKRAGEIMSRLCRMASQMHNRIPPVIHRDLKPQNIVVTEEDNLYFIDMGTVREYKANAAHDTVFTGSRITAAPEQYGYRQTDCRTDIYALGVIFLYLLTGSVEVHKHSALGRAPEQYRDIIEKCVRLEPAERYQSCEELKRAVEKAGSGVVRKKRRRRLWGLGAAALLCLAGVFGTAAYRAMMNRPYEFHSELIEEAVRLQLGKTDGDKISRAELAGIKSLRICGSRILEEDDVHRHYCGHHTINNEETDNETTGTIGDIADVAYMKNLRTLILDRQQITDISPLRSLRLTELSLCDNPLKDITVLQRMETLKSLALGQTGVSDLTPLSGLMQLSALDIVGSKAKKIEPLAGVPVSNLQMTMLAEEDYEVLKGLPLTKLVIHSWSEELEEVIGEAKGLKELTIYAYQHDGLEPLENLTELTMLDLYGGSLKSLDGIEGFRELKVCTIGETAVADIEPLVLLEKLQKLWVENSKITDFRPLEDMKSLRQIGCDEEQLEQINKIIEEPWFEIQVYGKNSSA